MKNPLANDFLWGAGTSSLQVEGYQDNEWTDVEAEWSEGLAKDAQSRLKAEVPDWDLIKKKATDPANYISGTAVDQFHLFETDFDLMKKIGLNAYRFSIEWSRVEPTIGNYSEEALEHYKTMSRELKKRGIEPIVVLHHFSNPKWVESIGGWHGKEIVERFNAYTEVVAEYLGSDVKYWLTINEPGSYLVQRYSGGGAWPAWPKTVLNPLQGYLYIRNVAKAHKSARDIIKSINKEAKVGLPHAIVVFKAANANPLNHLVVKILNFWPTDYLLNKIKDDQDFIGVNYYMRVRIKAGFKNPSKWTIKGLAGTDRNDMGWEIFPEGLYLVTQKLKKYGLPQIITENGIPDTKDKKRAYFIKDHVSVIERSVRDGADIRGYLYWSLIDNYEMSEGYWPEFGLIAVDRKTMKRTVRPSAYSYADIISKHQASKS